MSTMTVDYDVEDDVDYEDYRGWMTSKTGKLI